MPAPAHPPIADLLAAFQRGERSPLDVAEACFAAIDAQDERINALPTRVPRDTVRAQAARASQRIRRGEPVGLLAGLPYCAKDMHRTAGVRTTFGSPIFADQVPTYNDPVVQRLLDADAVLIAKSNTPEFAAGSQTFNPVLGATRNPFDTSRTVGGSSGGSAAALACGMTVVADGSDLAASLRNPASFCGVVGLRPSSRSDPLLRNSANVFSTLSMMGAMATRVADLRLVNRAIHAPELARPNAARPIAARPIAARPIAARPIDTWVAQLQAEAEARQAAAQGRRLRLAWTIDAGGAFPVSDAVRAAMQRAIDCLRDTGAELIEAVPDFSGADECFQALRGEYFVENLGELYQRERARMKDTVVWNIEQGLALTPQRLAAAALQRSQVFERVAQFMSGYDAWLLPTAQVLPFALDIAYPTEINGQPLATYIDWLKSCYWVTVSGHPGLTVPAGFSCDAPGEPRLPVGLQLVGRYGQDEALLDVGERVEVALAGLNPG
ncbi:MAG: amidase [Burkholderiales bacterium]|nr:amidase [Burkholderiales bacterium]